MAIDLADIRLPEAPRAYAYHVPEGLPLPTTCPGMSHALDWVIPGVVAICKEAEHRGCVWKVVLRRGTAQASLVAEWSLTARALAEELIARNRAETLATQGWTEEVDRLRAELVASRVIASDQALAEELLSRNRAQTLATRDWTEVVGILQAEVVASQAIASGQDASARANDPATISPVAPGAYPKRYTARSTLRPLVEHPEDQPGRLDEFHALAALLDPRDGTLAKALRVTQWLITQVMDNGRPVSADIARRVHALLPASLWQG